MGAVPSPFIKKAYCYKYLITIINLNTGKYRVFPFWGSVYNFEKGKSEMDEKELLEAFIAILQDGINYIEHLSPEEIMDAFGCDLKQSKIMCSKFKRNYLALQEVLGIDDEQTFLDVADYLRILENEDRLTEIIVD